MNMRYNGESNVMRASIGFMMVVLFEEVNIGSPKDCTSLLQRTSNNIQESSNANNVKERDVNRWKSSHSQGGKVFDTSK